MVTDQRESHAVLCTDVLYLILLTAGINQSLRGCDRTASPFQARLACSGSAIARSYLSQIGSTSSDSPVLPQPEMKIILEGREQSEQRWEGERERELAWALLYQS